MEEPLAVGLRQRLEEGGREQAEVQQRLMTVRLRGPYALRLLDELVGSWAAAKALGEAKRSSNSGNGA